MNVDILSTDASEHQLILIGILLVNGIFALTECNPGIEKNIHYRKVLLNAQKWNEIFLNLYVTPHKKGGK
jgi:hypothetical protein